MALLHHRLIVRRDVESDLGAKECILTLSVIVFPRVHLEYSSLKSKSGRTLVDYGNLSQTMKLVKLAFDEDQRNGLI